MKIIHVAPNFQLGGIQKAAFMLADRMAALGHEVIVLGRGDPGPYYQANARGSLRHRIVGEGAGPGPLVDEVSDVAPDVVHVHGASYDEPLLRGLQSLSSPPLVVSTPVFGRPPDDRSLLRRTRTCCVGVYAFYRLCRWLNISGERAIRDGIGYVPLTPFEPPRGPVSTLDDADAIAERRVAFGVAPDAFVVGRVGRNDAAKWHPDYERVIDALLRELPNASFLSIGFPPERGREGLVQRWPGRFIDHPETPDFEFIARCFTCFDAQLFVSTNGECFSATICEGAGLGVPTIASATPLRDNGQAEQAVDGVTGYLVRSADDALRYMRLLHDNRERLAELKGAAAAFAAAHWHADLATHDLLALYEAWADGGAAHPAVGLRMADEHAEFAAQYRSRIVRIMGASAPSRLYWRLATRAVESWPLFRAGRRVKSLGRPGS